VHVLVTGGCGYIGSHTTLELLTAGHRVTVVDNLSNSSAVSLQRVEQLAGTKVAFAELDLRDARQLDVLFAASGFDAVIHFAGLKAVGQSVTEPLRYYDNNLGSTLALCQSMRTHGVRRLVFSSSATVYGDPSAVPIPEEAEVRPEPPAADGRSPTCATSTRWGPTPRDVSARTRGGYPTTCCRS
jgi:UDP-glucose 4-epimerase